MIRIALVGLGYVGLGLAIALNKKNFVYGYDISEARIAELKKQFDKNLEVSQEELNQSSILFTAHIEDIRDANFYIVTVSTPAYYFMMPDLEPLISATKNLGSIIKKGDIIVFESTSYPGTVEEVCIPLIEQQSKLKNKIDFSVGYSPERINPNDKEHTLKNVPKVIAAQDEKTLSVMETVYKTCCNTVYPVSNIKTAEAVKILENTQRDINIALMNEFAEIMHGIDLNMHEIIEAAKTKWSFWPFKPGLVGGHCIAVDPQYLLFKARRLGINADLIATARKINDNMTHFIMNELIKLLIKNNIMVNQSNIGIFGISYKENVPDIRNSLSLKLIKELKNYGFLCQVNDPFANQPIVKQKYDVDIRDFEDLTDISVAIITVGHDYYRGLGLEKFLEKLNGKKIIMDIPNLFVDAYKNYKEITYWNL